MAPKQVLIAIIGTSDHLLRHHLCSVIGYLVYQELEIQALAE